MQNFVLPKDATYCILILQVVQFYCFLSATANCVNFFTRLFLYLRYYLSQHWWHPLSRPPKKKGETPWISRLFMNRKNAPPRKWLPV